jgi:hypothetical protein
MYVAQPPGYIIKGQEQKVLHLDKALYGLRTSSTTGLVLQARQLPRLARVSQSLISWQFQKQKVVALSTCEAEYIAATTAACQGIWLARLLGELQNKEAEKIVLKVVNKSAISLSKNPVLHDRSKHIDTRFHLIRDCVEDGRVEVEFIGTDGQLADILTKALGRVRFQELRASIGVMEIQ